MPQSRVRWHCTWHILQNKDDDKTEKLETRRLLCLKRLIIFHAVFYGGRQPPRTRWKATTRIINGGSGNRTDIPTGSLVWPAIGGEDAGAKTLTAPQKAGRMPIVSRWSGAAFNRHPTPGMKTRWSVTAACCADCANAA